MGSRCVACGLVTSRIWAIGFWAVICGQSAIELFNHVTPLFKTTFTVWQWVALVAVMLFFLHCACFTMQYWASVLVKRAFILNAEHKVYHHLLSPFFAMGLYRANARRLLKAWGLVVFIAVIGVVVANTIMPWRGIIDAGVVLNLIGGVLGLLYNSFRAVVWKTLPRVSADFPANDGEFEDKEADLPSMASIARCPINPATQDQDKPV
mmetsp:Transcript_118553/g.187738  ORF Transcript_118553/g.187738 Transcript_118553/m.187738 type:complete len:208 (+) Transcript_118553:68-691(+)